MKAFLISVSIGLVTGTMGYTLYAFFGKAEALPSTTISYTDLGFSPATTTVAKGAIVTWANKSSKDLWIGSGHHPIHDEYPEHKEGDCSGSHFDTCHTIPPKSSWSFTFNFAGTWHFHNHLKDEDSGVVVVEE